MCAREWNRVWAVGTNTYVRLYPNPGVCLCLGRYRIAVSWRGGVEVFRKHSGFIWQRIHAWGSRVQRPSGRRRT